MAIEQLKEHWQTLEGEYAKTVAEYGLHTLAQSELGTLALAKAAGGERVTGTRLQTHVAGLELENPLIVGAGWDKKGWAVDGLYTLGFAGTEVGSVLVHPQAGNPRPRLFYKDGVGLNRMGFNSKGMEAVARNLDTQQRLGVVGISIGKNKLTPDSQAPWAHAVVAERLHNYADYFVINVASPNTPGLRNLLNKKPLTDIVQAVNEVRGSTPLFVKTTVDLALADLDNVLTVCLEEGVTGVIDSNTTIDETLKASYGWRGQAGGLSGNITEFRQQASARMRHITCETRNTGLQRIGVGAIHDGKSAYERILDGAQAVQVVTAIRERRAKVANLINTELLACMNQDGVTSIQEVIGALAV